MNLEKFRTAFFNDFLSPKLTKLTMLFKEITLPTCVVELVLG
jgi:hypothetical protein